MKTKASASIAAVAALVAGIACASVAAATAVTRPASGTDAESPAPRSPPLPVPRAEADVPGIDHPLYAPWARVLSTYVDGEGLVDYAALRDRGIDDLRAFMDAIAEVDPGALESDPERMAFWINAYNAIVVWQVVERYPIESVRDVGALWGLVGGFFKTRYRIASADLHADDIEHGVLRAQFDDARIHWALVCGAFGCPRLIARPYLPADLDRVLDERAHEFIAQPRALQIDAASATLYLSEYFDWYAADFEEESATVLDYVLRYAVADDAAWIRENRDRLRVRYLEYDWELNDRPAGPRARRPIER